MTGLVARPLAQASFVLVGLALAMTVRLQVAGGSGTGSPAAGLVFAAALAGLAFLTGARPRRPATGAVLIGVLGALVLVAIPTLLRLRAGIPALSFPTAQLPVWVAVVTLVALAEEIVLRGVVFTLLERAGGAIPAVGLTSLAFGLMHVPLYGWGALPVDVAAGVWLGGLRLLAGSVVAPGIAHVLADIAGWWLM